MNWFSSHSGVPAQPQRDTAPAGPVPPVPARATGRPASAAGRHTHIRIADDLYLISHRDWDGKPLLPGRVLGLALAGAALCELAMLGRVTVRDGVLVVVSDADPAEELAQSLLQQLLSQPEPLPLRDWLAYLASGVTGAVGDRLTRAGAVEVRKGLRGKRLVPVDSSDAFYKAGRLAVMLDNGSQFNPAQAALIGLVNAAGLLERLPCVNPAAIRGRASAIMQSLECPLDGLIAETTAVVDNAILTGRT
jgi:hypothetical protein